MLGQRHAYLKSYNVYFNGGFSILFIYSQLTYSVVGVGDRNKTWDKIMETVLTFQSTDIWKWCYLEIGNALASHVAWEEEGRKLSDSLSLALLLLAEATHQKILLALHLLSSLQVCVWGGWVCMCACSCLSSKSLTVFLCVSLCLCLSLSFLSRPATNLVKQIYAGRKLSVKHSNCWVLREGINLAYFFMYYHIFQHLLPFKGLLPSCMLPGSETQCPILTTARLLEAAPQTQCVLIRVLKVDCFHPSAHPRGIHFCSEEGFLWGQIWFSSSSHNSLSLSFAHRKVFRNLPWGLEMPPGQRWAIIYAHQASQYVNKGIQKPESNGDAPKEELLDLITQ